MTLFVSHYALMGQYLLRVDDFPAWTESMDEFVPLADFEKFHDVLRAYEIPYMIAVTPQPALSPLNRRDRRTRQLTKEECGTLRRIAHDGTTIGLHGVTHHSRTEHKHSEFAGMDNAFFEEVVRYGDLELQRLTGIRADVFVPPFNRITPDQLQILGRRFKVVCGGPESVAFLGPLQTSNISSDSVYLPSQPPYYGRAHEIVRSLEEGNGRVPTCLTLHWEWERRRGYEELARLCSALQGRVRHWGDAFGISKV